MPYQEDDFELTQREKYDAEKATQDIDDRGAVFAKHKGMFILFIAMFVVLATAFVLNAVGVIPKWAMNCVIVPIAVVAVIAYVRARR